MPCNAAPFSVKINKWTKENMFLSHPHPYMIMYSNVMWNAREIISWKKERTKKKLNATNNEMFCFKEIHKSHKPNSSMGRNMWMR